MDQKMDILESKDLRRQPYAVPEGYFASLQERLGAIPRKEVAPRTRIRPMWAFATGIAAALAAVLLLVSRPGPAPEAETVSYEQYAYADLIPHTDPYIYFDIEP